MTALYGASQWTDLVKERNDVKASMGTKLFNYQGEDLENMHPGPIDNSPIIGEFPAELRTGLSEGIDFVLVTDIVAKKLFEKYKGGPQLTRKVINLASNDNPLLQIDFYPICFDFFECTSTPYDRASGNTGLSVYKSKSDTLESVLTEYKNQIKNYSCHQKRCWIKQVAEGNESVTVQTLNATGSVDVDEDTDTAGSVEVNVESSEVARPLRTPQRRLITRDITDFDGPWRLLRQCIGVKVEDVRQNQTRVQIIFEIAKVASTPAEGDWPRAELLQGWKKSLRPGDVVDCLDKQKVFREAVVTDVYEDGDLKVHFTGWGDEFDEIIGRWNIKDYIQPLFSKTVDWRARLDEDDSVDVMISELGEKRLWLSAVVMEKDVRQKRVLVQYKKSAKLSVLAKEAANVSAQQISHAVPPPVVLDAVVGSAAIAENDSLLASPTGNNNSDSTVTSTDDSVSTDAAPAPTVSTCTALVVVDDPDITAWYNLDGEDICALYTHTERPPVVPKKKSYSSKWDDDDENDWVEKHTEGKPLTRGAVGLTNLGNTCFMNSILQCMSNMEPITDFFLTNGHKSQLNPDNVLGSGGKLAQIYAKLLKDMWCDGYTKVIPRKFKAALSAFNNQFAGYFQQDSQECLGTLLDCLHEDLNRVQRKPSVQKIESKGRPDEQISRESWRRFLLRNDSAIVDTCYGQLKSHVTCMNPQCGATIEASASASASASANPKESVTFESFNCLTLPLPVKTSKPMQVTAVLLPAGSVPINIQVEVEPTDQMGDVKQRVLHSLRDLRIVPMSGQTSIPALSHLLLSSTNTYAAGVGKVSKNHVDTTPLGDALKFKEKLFLFELDEPCQSKPMYPVYNKTITHGDAWYIDFYYGKLERGAYSTVESLNTKGTPRRFVVNKTTTSHDIHERVWAMLSRYVKEGSPYYNNPANRPYILGACDMYGTRIKVVIQDEVKVPEIAYTDAVIAVWKKDALSSDHFDEAGWLSVREPVTVLDDPNELTLQPPPTKKIGGGGASAVAADSALEGEAASSATAGAAAAEIAAGAGAAAGAAAGTPRAPKGLSIYQCFDKFTESEQLASTETIYCSQCKEWIAPKKKMDIWATPDVLILSLKRFQFISGQYFVHREKISDVVDFPITGLDLRPYVCGPQDPAAPPIYDLFAVSHHSGGLGGGHYTAVCKNAKNSKWYNFNDSSVRETQPDEAVSEMSYVLFYRRQTGSARWAGLTLPDVAMPDED